MVTHPGARVAVIGGGIAGMGCAWALHRAGRSPTVYERRDEIGGNAKTHRWSSGGKAIVTGLSVLAWPPCYFNNYGLLLEELGVESEPTKPLRWFVKDGERVYAHGTPTEGSARYAGDLRRWNALVSYVRRANARLAGRPGGAPASLYEFAPVNPFHFIRLKWLCRAVGISSDFWEGVFVPIHSSSFLTVDLDELPASIAPAIEDIVSLSDGAVLRTWSDSSRLVFQRMATGFEGEVLRGRPGARVRRGAREVSVEDARGERRTFDQVVFACNAHDAVGMLEDATPLERRLLSGVTYSDVEDPTFREGVIHSDASVLPAAHRDAILADFANYIERVVEGGETRYENTFVLSSWVPSARGDTLPMLVSYNRRGPIPGEHSRVENHRAHPDFTTSNLVRAYLLRFLQGKRRTHYCSSFTTPGNGHDLSLLSGFVVAEALGARHPFAEHRLARVDFEHLRRFMLGR